MHNSIGNRIIIFLIIQRCSLPMWHLILSKSQRHFLATMNWTIAWRTRNLGNYITSHSSIFYGYWFAFGTFCSCILLISSPFILLLTVYSLFYHITWNHFTLPCYFYGSSSALPTSSTTILIPFITISALGTIYWIIALLISTAFHEFGHAAAASK